MNERVKHIYDEARQLTLAEQLDLARRLLEVGRVDGPREDADAPNLDAEWLVEAERRWQQHTASAAASHDAFEAIDEMRDRLAKRRRS